jgi:hypothetical protein
VAQAAEHLLCKHEALSSQKESLFFLFLFFFKEKTFEIKFGT